MGVTEDVVKDFIAVVYRNEERILSDIVYSFKEAKDFPPKIQQELLAQTNFKAVLDVSTLSEAEMERVVKMRL